MTRREIHLFYHDKCMDGMLAAGFLHNQIVVDHFHPLIYPMKIDPVGLNNMDIIITDYVIDGPLIVSLLMQGCRVFLLDHHITTREAITGMIKNIQNPQLIDNFFCVFDTRLSGAAHAYIFAHTLKEIINGGTYPKSISSYDTGYLVNIHPTTAFMFFDGFISTDWEPGNAELIQYLSNADTYFDPRSIQASRHIRLGIEAKYAVEPESSVMTYEHLHRRYQRDWSELETLGRSIDEANYPEYDDIISDATTFSIGGNMTRGEFKVMYGAHEIANGLSQRVFQTEPRTFFVVIARPDPSQPNGLALSLRGNNGFNEFNLSKLAAVLGGGGHFNGAGGRAVLTDDEYRDLETWKNYFNEAGLTFSGLLTGKLSE